MDVQYYNITISTIILIHTDFIIKTYIIHNKFLINVGVSFKCKHDSQFLETF